MALTEGRRLCETTFVLFVSRRTTLVRKDHDEPWPCHFAIVYVVQSDRLARYASIQA